MYIGHNLAWFLTFRLQIRFLANAIYLHAVACLFTIRFHIQDILIDFEYFVAKLSFSSFLCYAWNSILSRCCLCFAFESTLDDDRNCLIDVNMCLHLFAYG